MFKDYQEIENLIKEYFDAVYNADTEKLKEIFHPGAAMNGYLGDDCVIGTPEIFYADLSSKPSMKSQNTDCQMVIKNIDICGNIANASILVDNFFGFARIQDCFHLLKVEDEWKILCKTFTTL